MQKQLHAAITANNALLHLLEQPGEATDLIVDEFVDLTMSTDEFLQLFGPFLRSKKWMVKDKHTLKGLLRIFLSVFRLRTKPGKDFLAVGTVENLIRDYLEQCREDSLNE